jgi:hypothetical protein
MSYIDGIADKTGRLGEAEADDFCTKSGLYCTKPAGPDYGIDMIVKLNESSVKYAKIQVKGRRQAGNPRWFQLTVPGAQLRDAYSKGEDFENLWKSRIYMVDFWILVSTPHKEIWIFPSKIIHEIADANYLKYHTRLDNNYSQIHMTKFGKVAKKQKELNLDICDDKGIHLFDKYQNYKNNIAPILDFLHTPN